MVQGALPGKRWWRGGGLGSGLAPPGAKATHLKPRGPLVSSVPFRSNGACVTLWRDGHACWTLSATLALPGGASPALLGPRSGSPEHFTDSPGQAGGRRTRARCSRSCCPHPMRSAETLH